MDQSTPFAFLRERQDDPVPQQLEPPVSQHVGSRDWTYVMRGPAAEKALDLYHLIFAPTHACNLRCTHCYLPDHKPEMLPQSVALGLVDQWSDIVLSERGHFGGIFHVKGGEPFVVPYLGKIADRLIELKSLRFMLTTNGTIATPKALRLLRRCHDALDGNLTVIVSLDGATAATHDDLRGTGQFAITTGFVRSLAGAGINTFLNCVVHAGNVREMAAYLDLARDFNVAQVNFLSFIPKGFGQQMKCRQARHLTVHSTLQRLYGAGDERTQELLAGSIPDILQLEKRERSFASHECVAGYRGLLYIKPDGSTFTCPNLEDKDFSLGNVKSDTLRDILGRLATLRRRIRADGVSDRFLCTGERLRYQGEGGAEQLAWLGDLQREVEREAAPASPDTAAGVAYCVSRNY
jgi:MoaA/NifB/PqqE/SkfB family radical SAM enzyme